LEISKAKSTHFHCGTDGNGLIHRFKRISTESFISFFSSHNSRPYLPYEPSQPDRGASVLIYISMCSSFLSAAASRAFYEDFHFLKKKWRTFPFVSFEVLQCLETHIRENRATTTLVIILHNFFWLTFKKDVNVKFYRKN